MVTVYSKPNCMQCNFTKKYLEDKEVTFQVLDVTESEEALDHVKALGFSSLPVVEAEGIEPFSGFRPDRLESLAQD
ncbi:NrdH-redoxin [Aerococcus urinaehominis]|uniref:Glutaredoxin-like protein NrdH n=1 Tax=Aerococcus urinaehominis TaxID=128944 RepID=A0A0X8FJM6_9LACT|nr:glutaredoxin-like protein NrdH [Aerococcus urinaehominis]AMB98537.1 NrdH-redoxin [Aerococcus urinaehominis]SDL78975.1 ribonucleoside-diphosphate reductase class Ib glutaredoxin subunit [Aerococcus urinaehominis]